MKHLTIYKANGKNFATIRSAKGAITRFGKTNRVDILGSSILEGKEGYYVELSLPDGFEPPKKAVKTVKSGPRSPVVFSAPRSEAPVPKIGSANYATSNVLINSTSKEYFDKLEGLKRQLGANKAIDMETLQEVALELNDGQLNSQLELNAKTGNIYTSDVKRVLTRCEYHLMVLVALDLNSLMQHLKNGSIKSSRIIEYLNSIRVPSVWFTQDFRQAKKDLRTSRSESETLKILTQLLHNCGKT